MNESLIEVPLKGRQEDRRLRLALDGIPSTYRLGVGCIDEILIYGI